MKIYLFLVPFIVGVILTIFAYQAFTIYQLRAVVAEDHANLTQVVNFLNNQIQVAQQGQQGAKPTATATPSSTTTKK